MTLGRLEQALARIPAAAKSFVDERMPAPSPDEDIEAIRREFPAWQERVNGRTQCLGCGDEFASARGWAQHKCDSDRRTPGP